MAVKIITGNKLIDVKNEVIKSINLNGQDFLHDNIVVVPDRLSLIAEKTIFDVLNIKSTFNIKVVGINALAKSLISKANLNCVFVDGQESDFILFRALQKVKDDFVCFSKTITQGLKDKIKNALALIRSNKVSVSDLKNSMHTKEESMQKKLQDLTLVYEEYEKLLDSRLDATNILNVFSPLITKSNNYKNTNFYFCGFDSFTAQGYEIIKNIAKTCQNLTIGVIVPSNNKNSNIFDTEVKNNLVAYFKNNNIEFDMSFVKSNLTDGKQGVFDNVFSYKLNHQSVENYCTVFAMSSKIDEVEIVAKQIAYFSKNNIKYNNIQIATNKENFDLIENTFNKYNIKYFIDANKETTKTPFYGFCKSIFDLLVYGFDKENFITFVNNYFANVQNKNDIENYILENTVDYIKLANLKEFNQPEINYIIDFAKTISERQKVNYYCQKLEDIFDFYNLEQNLNSLCENFRQKNDLKNEKLYLQLYEKVATLNNKIKNILGDDDIDLSDFCELYLNALSSLSISSVPLGVDSVFVGDVQKSFFEQKDYMFVVGANQDTMPVVVKDLSLISDKDIEVLKDDFKISPTAKMINRRNKFKLFDLLSDANKKLFVTYSLQDGDGKQLLPATFALDLVNLKAKVLTKDYFDINFADDKMLEKIKFNNPNLVIALQNISLNKNSASLKQALDLLGYTSYNQLNKSSVAFGADMLNSSTTKISQIECYYNCPFKHFVNYGLKLVEQKNAEIQANDFGNFLHEFSDLLFAKTKDKLGNILDEQLSKTSEDIFNSILQKENYKLLNEKDNELTKRILLEEVIRFARFVNFEQSVSDFKILDTEFKFKNDDLNIVVNNQNYTVVGVVDRIDKCGDCFRIIDYKTGSKSGTNSKLSNLYYGTKIQVYVYLKAISNKLHLNPFGAFYLPISNAYLGQDDDDYKLHGYFLDDFSLISKADKTLSFDNPKSKLIEATLSTSKENVFADVKKLVRSKNVTKEELLALTQYAVNIVENGIKEILEGNIKASPTKGACDFCNLKSICQIDVQKNFRDNSKKLKPSDFLGGDNE